MNATMQKICTRSSLAFIESRVRGSNLHSYFPSPLIVSASSIKLGASISILHRNHRYYPKVCSGPNKSSNLPSVSRYFNTHRYRGGSQHHFRRGKRIDQNYTLDGYESDRNWGHDRKEPGKNRTRKNENNPFASLIQSQHRISKVVRQGAGAMFSLAGFLGSSLVSFTTDRRSFQDRFLEPIRALTNFLKTSGVDDELARSLNPRLGVNLCLLGRVHMYQAAEEALAAGVAAQKKKRRKKLFLNENSSSAPSSKINKYFFEEARRYMKYATAVYGQAMINAAEVDARGRLDSKVGRVTRETISTHISVPAEDIVSMDVSNSNGDSNHLRHMIVVDHEHKKVVLSIRGTFSLEEIVVDVAAFSREFCGGEAHSEMANMAERVWTVAGPKVLAVLEENPGYEFILTGHSLGAGTACLLTILVQNRKLLPREQKIRCFAYGSPPVYTPLEFAPKSVQSTANFVQENDVVPFLSIQKVRKLLFSLRAVDRYARNHMSKKERYKVVLGASEPPKDLIASVLEAEGKRLVPKKGAPTLYIPAEHIVWLKEGLGETKKGGGSYRYDLYNAREMAQREIRVYPDMMVDHLPPRYEHAFDHLEISPDHET